MQSTSALFRIAASRCSRPGLGHTGRAPSIYPVLAVSVQSTSRTPAPELVHPGGVLPGCPFPGLHAGFLLFFLYDSFWLCVRVRERVRVPSIGTIPRFFNSQLGCTSVASEIESDTSGACIAYLIIDRLGLFVELPAPSVSIQFLALTRSQLPRRRCPPYVVAVAGRQTPTALIRGGKHRQLQNPVFPELGDSPGTGHI